jgi:hypothetical protein
MRGHALWLAVIGLPAGLDSGPAQLADPYDQLRPCVSLSAADRRRIDAGATVVHTLPGHDRDVAVVGTRRVSVDGSRLAAWVRRIEQLKASSLVVGIRRLSDPPQPADFEGLTLDDDDLEAIRRCRPGDCAIKLAAAEIAALQKEIGLADSAWKQRIQTAFRELVLARVRTYLVAGHAGMKQYEDGRTPAPPEAIVAGLIERSCLASRHAAIAAYLAGSPGSPRAPGETFLYWSKEKFSAKPIVSVTHVVISPTGASDGPGALAVGKQLFATHYLNGSLNQTAIISAGVSGPHYLVVLNRSSVDVLGGLFGRVTRVLLERRLRSEMSQIVRQLGDRLEGGLPR